jgi:hypothetical protein
MDEAGPAVQPCGGVALARSVGRARSGSVN